MKIWEILNEEYIDKCITNGLVKFNIKVDENEDIALFDDNHQRMAISKFLLESDWEIFKDNGFERVLINSPYYSINEKGIIVENIEERSILDDINEININYFTNKELAEDICSIMLLHRKLEKFRLLNDSEKIDWENSSQSKYFIGIFENKIVIKEEIGYRRLGTVYFTSKEVAEEAISKFKNDIEKCITK